MNAAHNRRATDLRVLPAADASGAHFQRKAAEDRVALAEQQLDVLLASLKALVVHDTYSSEYDGRMYTRCPSCNFEKTHEHEAECEFVVAHAAIASVLGADWDALPPLQPVAGDRVPCPMCGKRVAFEGLRAHHRAVHGAAAPRPTPAPARPMTLAEADAEDASYNYADGDGRGD